ncbi:hypothetical protein [Jiella sp. M17.18]|uniref:hypothetical protein n=1 Tax=Jiella sp. M17.18 TaxID=3234247 RepID=UPI0034DF3C5E
MAVSRKKFAKPAHLQALGPASEATPLPQPLLDELAADFDRPVEWTTEFVDDLRVGDVVLVRAMLEPPATDNVGNPIKMMTTVEGGITLQKRLEEVYVAMVDRVYAKGPNGTVTVRMDLIWSSTRTKPTSVPRWGATFGQAKVIEEHRLPAGQRRREVLRLAGSGPEPEERVGVSAVEHSFQSRCAEFASMFYADENKSRDNLLRAHSYYGTDGEQYFPGSFCPTNEQIDAWRDGTEEAPQWAFDVLAETFGYAPAIDRAFGSSPDDDVPD